MNEFTCFFTGFLIGAIFAVALIFAYLEGKNAGKAASIQTQRYPPMPVQRSAEKSNGSSAEEA